MAKKVKVYYDREMDTLDMWFDEPPKEGYSREIEDGVIIKYDSEARVVGIEILFLSKQKMVVNAIPKEVKTDFEKYISEFVTVVKAIT